MKIRSQISTGQYEYSRMEEDIDGDFSFAVYAEKAKGLHEAHQASFAEKPENTLPDKEMGEFLYAQIHALGNHVETWEKMNPAQQTFVKLLKNALTRKKPEKKLSINAEMETNPDAL